MSRRFPPLRELIPVYAVISTMLSGWTILAFLWKLPVWIMILNTGEIFAIFSYSMLTNLVEGLTVIAILLSLCALLPSHFLREDFIVRGTILSTGLIGVLMAFLGSYIHFGIEKSAYLLGGPLMMLSLTAFLFSYSKLWLVRSAALWISDRLIVFLFILVPLTLFLSLYAILRMIL